jgi:hypothetical protein
MISYHMYVTPWLRIGTNGGSSEHYNEPTGSIKGSEFFG